MRNWEFKAINLGIAKEKRQEISLNHQDPLVGEFIKQFRAKLSTDDSNSSRGQNSGEQDKNSDRYYTNGIQNISKEATKKKTNPWLNPQYGLEPRPYKYIEQAQSWNERLSQNNSQFQQKSQVSDFDQLWTESSGPGEQKMEEKIDCKQESLSRLHSSSSIVSRLIYEEYEMDLMMHSCQQNSSKEALQIPFSIKELKCVLSLRIQQMVQCDRDVADQPTISQAIDLDRGIPDQFGNILISSTPSFRLIQYDNPFLANDYPSHSNMFLEHEESDQEQNTEEKERIFKVLFENNTTKHDINSISQEKLDSNDQCVICLSKLITPKLSYEHKQHSQQKLLTLTTLQNEPNTLPEIIHPNEYIIELFCKHMYHEECIEKWLKSIPKCPICRMDVGDGNKTSQIDYFPDLNLDTYLDWQSYSDQYDVPQLLDTLTYRQ